MSDFSAIGLPIYSDEDLNIYAPRLLEHATVLESHYPGFHYFFWHDEQGSELWYQVNENLKTIVGLVPAYAGELQQTVRLEGLINESPERPLDGVLHAWVNPDEHTDTEDGATSGDYPLLFTWVDKGVHEPLSFPVNAQVQITAFANQLSLYASEGAYYESQKTPTWTDEAPILTEPESVEPEDLKFSAESFIPSGMFVQSDDEPQQPTAMFIGKIQAFAKKKSSVNGTEFYWFRVKTLGAEYDVVADPDLLQGAEPALEMVLAGSFWLSGKIVSLEQ